MNDDPPIPDNAAPGGQTPPPENDRPADAAPPSPLPDIRRYRPGIAALAAVIFLACIVSYTARWADGRFFPDRAVSGVVCRSPGGALEMLPRGTTVGDALKQWGMETTAIDAPALKRKVADGTAVTVRETRMGRRLTVEELPPAQRYALGLVFDINRAAIPDITLIPGIGAVSAARIVAYRKAHGPLLSEADLSAVPGLGADKIRIIARYVSFGPKRGAGPDAAGPAEDTGAPRRAEKLTKGDPPVDINRATAADLMRIPGVGKITAARIIETREESGPFKTVADLEKVKGIGKKKAETIGAYVRF